MERADRTAAAGIAQLEGYLLVQAEAAGARAEAEAFAGRMPWLTDAQRDEVVRLYTDDRMALSRRMLEHIAQRCRQLRGEYGERYAVLRRRVLCRAVALVLAALTLCCCWAAWRAGAG